MLNVPVQSTTSLLKNGGDRHSRPVLELRHARLRPRRAMVARLLLSSPHGGLRWLAVDRAWGRHAEPEGGADEIGGVPEERGSE